MGRITIFSIPECPFCKRVKGAFKDREWDYVDINLEAYPFKRTDMLTLTNQLTVPQVFFNDEHIGGATDTLQVIDNYNYDTIKSGPDPTDPRLQVPDPSQAIAPEQTVEEIIPDILIQLPNDNDNNKITYMELMETLKEILPKEQHLKYHLTKYKNSFTGKQFINIITKHYNIQDENIAIQWAQYLQNQIKIIHHVADDKHLITNTEQYYYRLQCYHTPNVLNTYKIYTSCTEKIKNPIALVKKLKYQLNKFVTSDTNGQVNYKQAKEHTDYIAFEDAVCSLQLIDWTTMDDNTKLAFCINVYNLMIRYAFVKVGIGTSNLLRSKFFGSTMMNIGGYEFSFNEIENGILRNNKKAPYTLSVPFNKSDTRLPLIMSQVDNRIHFALNCGASSCPPVKNFTQHSVQEELRIVATAFCQDDGNIKIDKKDDDNVIVSFSKIFSWYRSDFAENNKDLPKAVVPFLIGEKKELLEQAINNNKIKSVQFLDYNWSTDASEFIPFDPSHLKANEGILL